MALILLLKPCLQIALFKLWKDKFMAQHADGQERIRRTARVDGSQRRPDRRRDLSELQEITTENTEGTEIKQVA